MNVFLLTCWATCGDHSLAGPLVFATFDVARDYARRDQSSPDWWFQDRPGRALRWRDPKNHDGGYWEILTCPVEGGAP